MPTSDAAPREGQVLVGPLFPEPARVETVRPLGPDTWELGVVLVRSERVRRVTLSRADLASVRVQQPLCTYRVRWDLVIVVEAHRIAAMLLRPAGRANALRTFLKTERDRGPEFLRLANALSALYPAGSEERGLLDAMLLAVPR